MAKRKFDSNTDVIVIDSEGIQKWNDEIDSSICELNDSLKIGIDERIPFFPGGESALIKFLSRNLKYPPMALKYYIEGEAIVTFVISNTGSVQNAKVIGEVDDALKNEALRVIEAMPKWFPGMQRGKFVNVNYTLPIRFTLRN